MESGGRPRGKSGGMDTDTLALIILTCIVQRSVTSGPMSVVDWA